MEDREIVDVIRALAAEERRVRQQRDDGLIDEETASDRLTRLSAELSDMWRALRAQRADRAAEEAEASDDAIELRSPGVIAS